MQTASASSENVPPVQTFGVDWVLYQPIQPSQYHPLQQSFQPLQQPYQPLQPMQSFQPLLNPSGMFPNNGGVFSFQSASSAGSAGNVLPLKPQQPGSLVSQAPRSSLVDITSQMQNLQIAQNPQRPSKPVAVSQTKRHEDRVRPRPESSVEGPSEHTGTIATESAPKCEEGVSKPVVKDEADEDKKAADGKNESDGVFFEGRLLPPAKFSAARRKLFEAPEEDIDADDEDEPIFCTDYVMEVYDNLREREAVVAIDPNYLDHVQLPGSGITSRTRALLVSWMMEVCLQFRMSSETMYLSVSLVDRFLSKCPVTRDKLQLVGVTAMFISSKFEEITPPILDDFVYISADAFSAEDIIDFERTMLQAVGWNLTAPFSLYFLRRFSKASGCDALQHSMGKYLLEQALLSYEMLQYAPSLQAAGAVYLARMLLNSAGVAWPKIVQYHSAYVESEVLPVAAALNALLGVNDPKLRFVVHKYRSSKLGSVSSIAAAHTREVGRTIDRRLMDQFH